MSTIATHSPGQRFKPRLMLRALLVLTAFLVIGSVGIITVVCWGSIQAAWYCYEIRSASTHDEARNWASKLCSGPARKAKLRVAVSQLGKGSGEFDYTLMEYVMWPE